MTAQLDLFEAPAVDLELEAPSLHWDRPFGVCGKCRWMDWALPGCYDGKAPLGSRYALGRCTNPASAEFHLSPDWTNATSPSGAPPNGSWRYVSADSLACDKVAKR